LLYWTTIPLWARDLWNDPNFSHGLIVPVFSGYLIWKQRVDLEFLAGNRSAHWGLAIVAAGLAMLIVGKASVEYFTIRASLVWLTGGLFLILFGPAGFRKCLFPLAFLLFMVPIPYVLYDAIAFPLKQLVSWFGEHSLNLIGVPVFREGNIISLPNIKLEVADACSGIRSLMSLFALATAGSYFMGLGLTRGSILVAAAVPISILVNAMRILITGILSYKIGQKAAEGFFHEFSGLLLFFFGAFLVLMLGVILENTASRKGNLSRKGSMACSP
jgi:exosortase